MQYAEEPCSAGLGCVHVIVPGLLVLSQSMSAHFLWLSQPSIVLNRAETKQLDSFDQQITYLTGVGLSAFFTLLGLSHPHKSALTIRNEMRLFGIFSRPHLEGS